MDTAHRDDIEMRQGTTTDWMTMTTMMMMMMMMVMIVTNKEMMRRPFPNRSRSGRLEGQ
jgi:hypothetical protein